MTFSKPPSLTLVSSVNNSFLQLGSAEVGSLIGFGTSPSNEIFPIIDAVAGGAVSPPPPPPVLLPGGKFGRSLDEPPPHAASESRRSEQTSSESLRIIFSS